MLKTPVLSLVGLLLCGSAEAAMCTNGVIGNTAPGAQPAANMLLLKLDDGSTCSVRATHAFVGRVRIVLDEKGQFWFEAVSTPTRQATAAAN